MKEVLVLLVFFGTTHARAAPAQQSHISRPQIAENLPQTENLLAYQNVDRFSRDDFFKQPGDLKNSKTAEEPVESHELVKRSDVLSAAGSSDSVAPNQIDDDMNSKAIPVDSLDLKASNLQTDKLAKRDVSHILENVNPVAPNIQQENVENKLFPEELRIFQTSQPTIDVNFIPVPTQMASNIATENSLNNEQENSLNSDNPTLSGEPQLPDKIINVLFNPNVAADPLPGSEIIKVQKSVQINIPQTCMATFRSARNVILRPKPITNLSLIQGVLNCLTDITEEELKEGHHHTPEDVAEDVIRHSDFQYYLGDKHHRAEVEGRSNNKELEAVTNAPQSPIYFEHPQAKDKIEQRMDNPANNHLESGSKNEPYFYDPQILPNDFPRRGVFEGPQFAVNTKTQVEEKGDDEKQQLLDGIAKFLEISRQEEDSNGLNNILPGDNVEEVSAEMEVVKNSEKHHQEIEKSSLEPSQNVESLEMVPVSHLQEPESSSSLLADDGPSTVTKRQVRDVSHVLKNRRLPQIPKSNKKESDPIFSVQNSADGPSSSTVLRHARDVSHLLSSQKAEDPSKLQSPLQEIQKENQQLVSKQNSENGPSTSTALRHTRDVSHLLSAPKLKDEMQKESDKLVSTQDSENGPTASVSRHAADVSYLLSPSKEVKSGKETIDEAKSLIANQNSVTEVRPLENFSATEAPSLILSKETKTETSSLANQESKDLPQSTTNSPPQFQTVTSIADPKSINQLAVEIVTPTSQTAEPRTSGPLEIDSTILSIGPQISEYLEVNQLLPPILSPKEESIENGPSIAIQNTDVTTQGIQVLPEANEDTTPIVEPLPPSVPQKEAIIPSLSTQAPSVLPEVIEQLGQQPNIELLPPSVSQNQAISSSTQPPTIDGPSNEIGNKPLALPKVDIVKSDSLVEISETTERKIRDVSHLFKPRTTVATMDPMKLKITATIKDEEEKLAPPSGSTAKESATIAQPVFAEIVIEDIEKNTKSMHAETRVQRDVSHLLRNLGDQTNLKVTVKHTQPDDTNDQHSRDIALLFGADDFEEKEFESKIIAREIQTVTNVEELPLDKNTIIFNTQNEAPVSDHTAENNIMDVLQRTQRSSNVKLETPFNIDDQIAEDDPYVENIFIPDTHRKVKRSTDSNLESPAEMTSIASEEEITTTITPYIPRTTVKTSRAKLPLTVFAARPKRYREVTTKSPMKTTTTSSRNIIRPKRVRKPM
ncbi:uncharacterized protein LOC133327200 [Musca vetustissima]|uniref:uncharacterized protein LOC133327200 n=1 Tax=Musca vetustissima TaxID=27455 RepID=UPI002AB64FAC|nr:uncharacterized protein LOC133327200 [Musca vetustissima]